MSQETWTVRRMLAWSRDWLEKKGVDSPRLDGELLLAHALKVRRLDLFIDPDRPLIAQELADFKALIKRRAEREPTAYILGTKSFWTLDLVVRRGVLIPRPDTESLVEAVLARIEDREAPLSIWDAGVGSGAILLSLLSELKNASGVGSDLSEEAVACSRENAEALDLAGRVEILLGDLAAPLAEGALFDVVVSNPPYVGENERETLEPDVREWEPTGALFAGPGGLDLYPRLLGEAFARLKPGGLCAVEIGVTQGEAVADLMAAAGFSATEVLPDYTKRPRVVVGNKS